MRYKSALLTGAAAFFIINTSPAFAQAAAGGGKSQSSMSDSALQEIIVTAQKRSESVQNVPIAISAFTGEALAERQISNIAAIGNITPNVNLDAGTPFSGSTSVLGAFIRGIGQNDFAVNVDPGVGVYLDGIYLARTIGANFDLPDVERIEILKGPQGTLFGRNTIGGAINVVTRDPAKELGFKGSVTTGRYNRLDADGVIDIPITDSLQTLFSFSVKNRDGYAKRVPYSSATPYVTDDYTAFNETGYDTASREGGEHARTGRIKVKWEATTDLTVRLSADYSRTDQSATPTALLGVRASPGSLAGLYNFCISSPVAVIDGAGLSAICGPGGTPVNPGLAQPPLAGVNVDADPTNNRLPFDNRWLTTDPDKSYATGNSFSRLTNWGLGATVDLRVTDTLSLRSITGYRNLKFNAGIDADNSPLEILSVSNRITQHQFSEELQALGSLLDDKLKYVVGAYYFTERGTEDGIANIASSTGLQVDGPVYVKTRNYAFFSQVDYQPVDLVSFTVGARYTNEDKKFEAGQTDLNGFLYKISGCTVYGNPCSTLLGFPDPSQPLRLYPSGIQHRKFSNFSPKFGVQLHPNQSLMVYGSYSVGYKSGGWSTRLQSPLPTAPAFDEEEAKTFEGGIKATLLNRHLQTNLAVFSTKYDGIQLLYQAGASPIIQNAGTARIRGFEFEVTAAPIDILKINASVGYLDTKLTNVLGPAVSAPNADQAGLVDGAPLPKVPRWKFNISPRLELPLANGGNLVVVADYSRISSVWNDSQRTYLLKRPATEVLAASVTYREPDGRWDLTVGGTNLTNDRYIVNGLAQLAGGLIYGSYNRPREWYAKLGFRF